jgi:hypothetical protein
MTNKAANNRQAGGLFGINISSFIYVGRWLSIKEPGAKEGDEKVSGEIKNVPQRLKPRSRRQFRHG